MTLSRLSSWFSAAKRRRLPRQMSVEACEARLLLASDVTVEVDGNGILHVSGDELANEIRISAAGDQLVVEGLGRTRVNGSRDPLHVPYVFELGIRIVVDLRGGDDTLQVDELGLPDYFLILEINAGLGRDTVNLEGVVCTELIIRDDGGGVDLRVGSTHTQDLAVVVGAGPNRVVLTDLNVEGVVQIHSGGPLSALLRNLDVQAVLIIEGSEFDDAVFLEDVTIQNAGGRIHLNGGADLLSIEQSQFQEHVFIDDGPGRDQLFIDDASTFNNPDISEFDVESSLLDRTALRKKSALERLF
jgi:hypothetical protein